MLRLLIWDSDYCGNRSRINYVCFPTFDRYGDIIPYDHNRVVLKKSIHRCDYVNASWITNDSMSNQLPTFIAAQGPMKQTIPYFLQMIMENEIKTIVMLTKLQEKTKGPADYF